MRLTTTALNKLYLSILIILTLGISVFFINSKQVSFSDELLFEEASFRMATTGEFLTANLSNHIWLEKPPLYFWLTAPVFHIANFFIPETNILDLNQALDENHIYNYPWIRRVWTTIATAVSIIITYLITKQLTNSFTGFVAGLILLTTPHFLFTTLSASLDLTAAAWITVAMYAYLQLIKRPSRSWMLTFSLFTSFSILTRSLLGLTPLMVVAIDQILNPKHRLPVKTMVLNLTLISLLSLPWHVYQAIVHTQEFFETYLGFNFVDHAINLTPGYAPTMPWFYITVHLQNPWFYPVLATFLLLIFKNKKTPFQIQKLSQNITKRSQTQPQLFILVLWFLIPTLILSLASTRHNWYLIQTYPPIAVLSAMILVPLYQKILSKKLPVGKYLFEIFALTFLLSPITLLVAYLERDVYLIEIFNETADKLPDDHPIYNLDHGYFPSTLLYNPHPVKVIGIDELESASQNTPFYIFVSYQSTDQVLEKLPQLQEIDTHHNLGTLYHLPEH